MLCAFLCSGVCAWKTSSLSVNKCQPYSACAQKCQGSIPVTDESKMTKSNRSCGRNSKARSSSPFMFSLCVYVCVCVCAKLLQSCLILCDSMDCSLPGSSVHGILQARILEWVTMPSSTGSFQPGDQTCVSYVSYIGRQVFYHLHHLESPYLEIWFLQTFLFLLPPLSTWLLWLYLL